MKTGGFPQIGWLAVLLCAVAALPAAGDPPQRTGWAELSAVTLGTPLVVHLADGRHLERTFVRTTADQLVTLDFSAVPSYEQRQSVIEQVRRSPEIVLKPFYAAVDGRSVPVAQAFGRDAILSVERPRPLAFELPKPVAWFLQASGPCPNCDPAQTEAGRKPTTLPSPLHAGRPSHPLGGEPIYVAPTAAANPLDQMAWEQLRLMLPAGLRVKESSQ